MTKRLATDEQIAEALRAEQSMRRAAERLGYSYNGLRARVCASPELSALCNRRGPSNGNRVVSDAEIVAALAAAGTVAGAARALGVWRGTIAARRSPEVAAALATIPDRIRSNRSEALDKRRAAVSARIKEFAVHKDTVRTFRERYELERDTWILDAMAAGLSQKEMGDIYVVTRQRVQQIEASLGLSRRAAE